MKLPNKLDLYQLREMTDTYAVETTIEKVNQLIDYLSDKEASKGECKHLWDTSSARCQLCGEDYYAQQISERKSTPPQQEESRGGCDKCGGLPFKHKEWCGKPQLKEESPGTSEDPEERFVHGVECLCKECTKQLPEPTPQADWVKAIESLRTSPTGAINIVFYNNGKMVGRVGVNKIEDLKEDLTNLFKYELTLAQQRTEKKWREKIRRNKYYSEEVHVDVIQVSDLLTELEGV